MDPNERPLTRKPSTTLQSYLSRSASARTPGPSTSSLNRPRNRNTSAGFRSLINRFRDNEPEFEMLTPARTASSTTRTPPAPPVSPLTKLFVNALTTAKLSNFLVWMLYYDIAELPDSAESWYKELSGLELRGWVALGAHLKKTKTTGYGFDLIVLDSICDRLRFSRPLVHSFLIKFADPETMRFSTLALVIREARATHRSELETLEAVQTKVQDMICLAKLLTPSSDLYSAWQAVVQKRITGFLDRVIRPRVSHHREGTPLVTAGTSEQLSVEVRDGIQLNYVYEALLQERVVPVWRYGEEVAEAKQEYKIPLSLPSSPSVNSSPTIGQKKKLVQENERLRSQVINLQTEKDNLEREHHKQDTRLATLRALQALQDGNANDTRTPDFWSWPSSSPVSPQDDRPSRSPSSASPTPYPRAKQYMTAVSNKYADVFSSLDNSPVSRASVQLSNPASPVIPERSSLLAVNHAAWNRGRGRRSGRVFDKKDLAYLANVREGNAREEK